MLALLVILTGCVKKEATNDIVVTDVCCPYEIRHQEDGVQITLRDGLQQGILWQVQTLPEAICQVTQETIDEEFAVRYRLVGKAAGAAEVTFTAVREDASVCFVLSFVANVDDQGKTVVSANHHRESEIVAVEAEGLSYQWNVDVSGVLRFAFFDTTDGWTVAEGDSGVFTMSGMMSTPSGCEFSAQASTAGQATVKLVGENSGRSVLVTLQADEAGNMEVLSVQEQ